MQPLQTQPSQQPPQQPQYPLGKKPQLNQKQMKNMRMVLQSVNLPEYNNTYYYNIVQKQSGSGLFDNQRLLFLNLQAKAVSYLSKIPHGFLPYTNYDEIASNKVKQKVIMTEVEGFKCNPVKGKISSMVMEWIDKDKKEKKWTFILGSSKLMNDWVGLVNSVKDGTYDKEKYENMNRLNQLSPLTSNQPLTPQKNNGLDQPINQTQPINPQENNNQPISAQTNNPNQPMNPQSNQQNIPPLGQLGYGSQKPNQENPIVNPLPFGYNNQNSSQSIPQQNTPLGGSNTLGYQGLNSPTSNLNSSLNNTAPVNNNQPYNSTNKPSVNVTPLNNPNSTVSNNYLSPSNNSNRLNPPPNQNYLPNSTVNNQTMSNPYNQPTSPPENLPTFHNLQKSKQPTLPNNFTSPPYQSPTNLANSTLIPGNQSVAKPQSTYMQGGQLQISRKPKIGRMGESAISPSDVQPPQTFVNYNTSSPISNNSYLPSSNTGHTPKQQNLTPASRNNQLLQPPPPEMSRPLTHNSSEPPGDFVEELKRKRQKNPEMFVLNNQLSRKNLNDYNSPPYEQPNQPAFYNTNQSYPNQPISPQNQRVDPMQRMASQNQMIREPSQQNIYPNDRQSVYGSKESEHRPIPRQNTNQNTQPLVRDPSTRQFNKDPSKSQFSRNLQMNDIHSKPSNEPQLNQLDDYQGYKPTTSYPQSTKNLNKIRSDYLQRKASNLGSVNNNQPSTTKNQHNRLMENNYMMDPSQHSKKPSEPYSKKPTQQSFQKLPKFDSSQSRRQDSINNLNKVASSYMSSKQKNYPSYNDIWLETSNPNKKLQVHDQFMARSRQLVCQIVDEIPLPKSQRQFQPVESDDKENLYTFIVENMIIKLHFFTQQESINDTNDNINEDAPVLYSHSTYYQLKREFYNYNLILSVTGNQGRIKVPLCSYIQYRGILALVKADIPISYKQVEPYTYSDQFQALQNMIKVRFMFGTFNCYESQGYRGGEGKFVVVWNLRNLIPGLPGGTSQMGGYFRKELLMQYDQILQDLQTSSEAHAFTLRHIVPDLISKLQSLQVHVLCSNDLLRQCHRVGLSLSYLPQIYKQTNSQYLKKLIMSQIVSQIFTQVVRSQLNHAFAILPAQNMQKSSPQQLNHVVVACAHVLINEFFSYTQRSQSIWKLIVNQASKRYRMIVSKQDVIGGYLLSSIVSKLSIQCDFKQKSFLKQKKFFVHQNIIPREVFITFVPKCRHYDMQAICPAYSKCKQIIESQEMTMDTYEQLSMILNLRTRTTELPEYYRPIMEQLKTYIANYIPYTSQHEYEHLDVYEFMYEQPITYNGTKTAFLAIKWLIKANQVEKANQLFQIKFHQLSYWLSEYNTSITEFYDFFSMYYASIGDYDQSICLAKSSLINMTKVLGSGALPVADKHYQLGNIYFKINKKNQALKEYNKTKQILINHDKIAIPEYGIILLKIALLCLNFGELTECLSNAIEAERIFQNNGGNEHEEIECFEILARVYEITRKQQDMSSLCEACSKTFNLTQNPKILQRMLKIVMYPKLTGLSSQQQKSLLHILNRLQQHSSPNDPSTYLDSFNFLHRQASKGLNLKRKTYYYLENAVILGEQINRRDLLRRHSSYSDKTSGDAEDMLVVIEAVGNMVGWSFLIGALKEGGYYD